MNINEFNKFTFAILQIVEKWVEEGKKITADTKIKELYDDYFDDFIWNFCLTEVELLYGIRITNDLFENKNLSILELSSKLDTMPIITDNYPEFYYCRTTYLRDRILKVMAEFDVENGDYLGLGLIDKWVNYLEKKD